jgi:predicted nucleotide-binding protein (sugar kinase/HSP70/actin superfamily)
LVALEISSFKCGHDAPIYGVVEGIIEQSGTPYFCFKDLDENKPSGSIKIRVETIDYFLRRYREEVIRKRKAEQDIEAQLAALEAELRNQKNQPETSLFPQTVEQIGQGIAAD